MTPQEKAKELFDKMCHSIGSDCEHDSYCSEKECTWKGMTYCRTSQKEAIKCALIAIDEIIEAYYFLEEDADLMFPSELKYYNKVKAEIEKL